MFDIKMISYNKTTGQYTCSCQCSSPSDAKELCAKYISISRMVSAGEMYQSGSTAIIGAGSADDVQKVANVINANHFMPPLDVYVFYGSNERGLQSRWCVGFDFPQASHLIDILNTQGSFINADKNPKSWQDIHGKTYSVILLSGVIEQEPSAEELNDRVNRCLTAIVNVTFRRINLITVQ